MKGVTMMGLGGLAVIGVAVALAVASVAGVLGTRTGSDDPRPIDLVDARTNEADDDARAAGDEDDDRDDTTGDGPSADRSGLSVSRNQESAPDATGGDATGGDTTDVGARPAPAPAPAPAGNAPAPAPRPAPAPVPRSAPAPAPAPAPAAAPADSTHSVDAPSADSGDTSG